MIVAGFDPASSLAGAATAINNELSFIENWKPEKRHSKDDHLLSWFNYVGIYLDHQKPDVVGYEQVQSARNLNTVRVLSRWEGAIIIQARQRNMIVQPVRVSQARALLFGDGKTPKDSVYDQLKARYPSLPWATKVSGGLDQADAAVVALTTKSFLQLR